MTCHHVIWVESSQEGNISRVNFTFDSLPNERFWLFNEKSPSEIKYNARADIFFAELSSDFVIKMKSKPIIFFKEGTISQDLRMFIIHHPSGGPLKVSPGTIWENHPGPWQVTHQISTQPGSSGSPIVNANHEVFAIHNGGLDGATNFATAIDPLITFILNGELTMDFFSNSRQITRVEENLRMI